MSRALFIGIAALVVFPSLALAQSSTINNENVCSSPGYGQDPRCVGSSVVGNWSDGTFATQQRFLNGARQPPRRR